MISVKLVGFESADPSKGDAPEALAAMVTVATLAMVTAEKPLQSGTKLIFENALGVLVVEILEPESQAHSERFVPTATSAGAAEAVGLSEREIEIVTCLVDGDSNKHIARRLAITEATVKIHMKNLLRKLRARNRTQAALWGKEHGFTPFEALPGIAPQEKEQMAA